MHVLGLPPAFVLSQDQTLKLKHPKMFLTERPCTSSNPLKDRMLLLVVPTSVEPPNSEADTWIIGLPLPGRYTSSSGRHRPNRPHISSDSINVKERGNKSNLQHHPMARPANLVSSFSVCFQSLALPSATVCNHRRFGEGRSTETRLPPQPPFSKIHKLSSPPHENPKFHREIAAPAE